MYVNDYALQGVPKKPKTIEITYCWNLNALTLTRCPSNALAKRIFFAQGNLVKILLEFYKQIRLSKDENNTN